MPETILTNTRAAFGAHPVLTAGERRRALEALATGVRAHADRLCAAVSQDFGYRPAQEVRLIEIVPLLDEIAHLSAGVGRWMRARRVWPNWPFMLSRAMILPQPKGVVGILSPWNYPLLLTLSPLANALAAGNHAVLKPSEHAPATAEAMRAMLAEVFPETYVAVVTGDAGVAAAFSALPFDHLVFTGSTGVGRQVMAAAAANLVPVTLELGGKSPAIVHESFPVAEAAERIVTAKLWNAGQTCVAPDYVLVPERRLEAFVAACEAVLRARLPEAASADYGAVLHGPDRMAALVTDAEAAGARVIRPVAEAPGKVAPVLLVAPGPDTRVMREEIFGPLLPIVPVADVAAAVAFVNARARPLALYYFDRDRGRIDRMLRATWSGGVTVNDCIYHLPQVRLPFGGVGASGMGAYHGRHGFEELSHMKAVLVQNRPTGRVLARLAKPPYGRLARRVTEVLSGRAPRGGVRRFDPNG
jgi:coniferyl-aldehyde dehydrogenase